MVGPHEGPCGPGTVFVYSGQGSQWAQMGAELLATEPVFAATVAAAEPLIVRESGFSVTEAMTEHRPGSMVAILAAMSRTEGVTGLAVADATGRVRVKSGEASRWMMTS